MYRQTEIIILGSASPRRKSLLEELGVKFEISAADLDEKVRAGEHPRELTARLACAKARKIAEVNRARFILGADTDVTIDGEILGKPKDGADACRLLQLIQGRTHTVWGSCALVNISRKIEAAIVSSTLVTMRAMTQSEIEQYVATGEPFDKAGAYAVQGIGSQFISHIEGSYPNVVGLDTPRVMALLKEHGVLKGMLSA